MLQRLLVRIGLVAIVLGSLLTACNSAPQPSDLAAQPELAPTEAPTIDPASLTRRDLLLRAWSVQMAQSEASFTFKADGTVDQVVGAPNGTPQTLTGRWELRNNDTQLFISYGEGNSLLWDITEISLEQLRLEAAPQPGSGVKQSFNLIPKE